MKKYFLPILIFLLLISITRTETYAQENPEDQAKKYNVIFPVTELGNCNSVSECKTYCDDPTHREACVGFAKKKGFYKQPEIESKKEKIIQAAKNELGCDSEESCKAVCQHETNFNKCQKFAEKNGLENKHENPGNKKVLEKAKTILGCDSPASCKAICEQESNRDKCDKFAKETGLGGGKERVGPGGCNSEESCRAFCEKNPEECRKFGGGPGTSPDSQRQKKGPGGCDSEESCRKYCNENPTECKNENKNEDKFEGKQYDRKGPGGCDSEESCNKYCRENPQECGKKPIDENRDNLREKINNAEKTPEEWCKNNPEECKKLRENKEPENIGKERGDFQKEDFCKNNPEKCKGPEQKREQNQEMKNFQPEKRNEEFKQEMKLPGEIPPQKQDASSDVKGISTTYSLFQNILNLLFGKK